MSRMPRLVFFYKSEEDAQDVLEIIRQAIRDGIEISKRRSHHLTEIPIKEGGLDFFLEYNGDHMTSYVYITKEAIKAFLEAYKNGHIIPGVVSDTLNWQAHIQRTGALPLCLQKMLLTEHS